MNTQPKLKRIILIIAIALFLIKPNALLADEPSKTLSPMEGAPHAGEAEWSPEALSRRKQLEFYEMTPDGKVQKILDTGAIDAKPPHRGAIFQVNKQTGDVEITKYDEGLTPADKKRLNNIARDNLGSVGGKTLNEVTGKGTKLTDPDKPPVKTYDLDEGSPSKQSSSQETTKKPETPSTASDKSPGSQKPTVKIDKSPPSQSSAPEKTKISEPPPQSSTPGKVTEILERHGGKITVALTAAMAINCVAQGKTIKECAIELAEGVAIGGAMVVVLGPTGATLVAGGLGAWEIYKAGVEATQQWADAQQRSAAYQHRETQTQINLENIEKYINELREKIYRELQPSMVNASEACRVVEGQLQSSVNILGGDIGSIDNLADLVSAIKTASSACKGTSALNIEIAELLSKSKNYEDKIIQGLEWARGKAEKCNSKEDANNIRKIYDKSISLAARIPVYSAIAKGKNNKLNQTIDKVNEARTALSTAQAMVVRIIEKAALITSIKNSTLSQIKSAEERKNAHLSRCNSMLGEIDQLQKGFPDNLLLANEEKFNELRGLVATFRTFPCEPNPKSWIEDLNFDEKRMNARVQDARRYLREANSALSSCQGITSADQTVESIEGSASWVLSAIAMNEDLPQKADACLSRLGDKDARDRISRLRNDETNPNKPKGRDSTGGSGQNINVTDSYDKGRTTRSGQDSQQVQGTAGSTQAERNTTSQAQHEGDKGNIDAQGQATGNAITQSQREHAAAQQTAQQERQTSLGTTVARGVAGGLTSGVATGVDSGFGTLGRGAGQQVSSNMGIQPKPSSTGADNQATGGTTSAAGDPLPWTYSGTCNGTVKAKANFGAGGSVSCSYSGPSKTTLNADGSVTGESSAGFHVEFSDSGSGTGCTSKSYNSTFNGSHSNGSLNITSSTGSKLSGSYNANSLTYSGGRSGSSLSLSRGGSATADISTSCTYTRVSGSPPPAKP